MSKYVPFLISPSAVTLTLDGETVVVNTTSNHHKEIVSAIKVSDWQKVRDLADTVKRLEVESKGMFKVNSNNAICIGDEEVPSLIQDRIREFADQGLPYEPIKNFWDNLKLNPSYRARHDLFSFLEHNGHPLTEDGCFIAYKRVREDFKDCHSGKYDNTPGAVIEMPREKVDDNPNVTCSAGLHVANRNYASNFYGGGRLLYCKVNPRDVVAIPTDYNNEKMRCCRYEVLSEDEGERKEALFCDGSSGSWSSQFNAGFDDGMNLGLEDGDEGILTRNLDRYIEMYHEDEDEEFGRGFREGYQEGLSSHTEDDDEYDDEDEVEQEVEFYNHGYSDGSELGQKDYNESISRDVDVYIEQNGIDDNEAYLDGFREGYHEALFGF